MDAEESEPSLIAVKDFMSISTRIFDLFALQMTNYTRQPVRANVIFRYVSFFCVSLLVGQAYLFILVHFGGEGMFIVFTYNLSCVGFGFVLALKIYMVGIKHKNLLLEVINELDSLFPKTKEDQEKYEMKKYLRNSLVQNGTYSVLMMCLFAYFNFSNILTSIFKFFFIDGSYDRDFTLFMWFPFGYDGKSPVVFEIFYMISIWSGFTCLIINTAADLLYCSVLTVLCMEFENLQKKFEKFGKGNSREDFNELVKEHSKLIR